MSVVSTAAPSPTRRGDGACEGRGDIQTSNSGPITTAPMASPIHQSHHSETKLDHGCRPPAHRVVTPMLALDDRTGQRAGADQRHDVAQPIQRGMESQATQQRRADERFQRISRCDGGRRQRRLVCRPIGEKRA
jgi:hypothetical protein